MNIYDYLKLDHEHVANLFKQFENSQVLERRKQIVALISIELMVHAHSEQETFYRALKQFETTKEEAFHGQKEHKEIEDQISLVLHSKEFGSSWVKKVEKLKDIVEHHVKEEEGTIFTEAQKVLSPEHAYDLKEQMHFLKQQFLLSLQKETTTANVTKKEHRKKTIHATSKKKSPLHEKAALKKHESRPTRFH